MVVTGREDGNWGIRTAADGFHVIEFGEGIDKLKKEDGTEVVDKNGNVCYKFPAKINDEKDEDNGLDLSILIYSNKFGEQKVADIIACAGGMEFFEKTFPGDRSFFEDEIMSQIKIKMLGKFVRVKKETTVGKDKDGNPKNYSNIVRILDLKVPYEDEKKDAGRKEAPKSTNKGW